MIKRILLLFMFAITTLGHADLPCFDSEMNLMKDLMIVDYWNKKLRERLPVTYDHFLSGGYFVMPSARMGDEGEFAFGYSSVPPYRNYSLRCQLLRNLEITGSYRIFDGIPDPLLSPFGFGDFSDKGVNVKFALFLPEDSGFLLPGIAIGAQDFFGTKAFNSQYIVLTHVIPQLRLEASLGYGFKRIKRWYGGIACTPFYDCSHFLKGLTVAVEYDATDYLHEKHEHHPHARRVKSRINGGLKYRFCDIIDVSVSSIRGLKVAWSVSAHYNFGYTEGLVPKINAELPYQAPWDTEPLGYLRTEEVMVHDFLYALRDQGFDLLGVWLLRDECDDKVLRLKVHNCCYFRECEMRERVSRICAFLTPSDIDKVVVVIECEGFSVQEYHFYDDTLERYRCGRIGDYEFDLFSMPHEVKKLDPYCSKTLFKTDKPLWNFEILPKTQTMFGSSTGKFKYALGINFGFDGFWKNYYYVFRLGVLPFNNLESVRDFDILNPSQLINVHTDIINYYKHSKFSLDEAYIQRNWNLGCGFFARLAGGYFSQPYFGVGGKFFIIRFVAVGL